MIDVNMFRTVRELDFSLLPALDLRKYSWASVKVYSELVASRMLNYNSKFDLLHWFSFWTEKCRLSSPFEGDNIYEELIKTSSIRHDKALKNIFSTYKENSNVHTGYDIWNAIDSYIVFQNCPDIKNVIDFGSGYGRLGAIFGNHEKIENYLSIDSIEHSYILQSLFLSALFPEKFYEYIDYTFCQMTFEIELQNKQGNYHLPAWKWNIIPDNSIDLIMAVFVLPEINEFALNDFINQSSRTLKKGGYIYIRDHLYTSGDNNHEGAHKENTEKQLKSNGFQKIYEGKYEDNVDIYGIPRIYQFG